MSRTVAPKKPRTAGALAKPLTPSPELAAVVGAERITMFELSKVIGPHLTAA